MPYRNRDDQAAAGRRHYEQNKEKIRARAAQARRERRLYVRQYVRDLKENNPCTDCGQFYRYWIMQYDHTGTDKIANIANLVIQGVISKVQMEIAKCELVCANCHFTRTHIRQCDNDQCDCK